MSCRGEPSAKQSRGGSFEFLGNLADAGVVDEVEVDALGEVSPQ